MNFVFIKLVTTWYIKKLKLQTNIKQTWGQCVVFPVNCVSRSLAGIGLKGNLAAVLRGLTFVVHNCFSSVAHSF